MADYETLGVIGNLLTLDEFVEEVKQIARDNNVDKDNVRIAALGNIICVEENCPECNCDAPEVQDNDGFHIELWCPDCGHVFKVPAEKHCCHIKDGVTEENFLDVEGLTAE